MMDKTIVILFAVLSAADQVLGQDTCTYNEGQCQNGGSCFPINGVYTCWCFDGYAGTLCEKAPACDQLTVSGAGELNGIYEKSSTTSQVCDWQLTYGRLDGNGYIFYTFDWSYQSRQTWYISAQLCQTSPINMALDASNDFPQDLSWPGGISVTCGTGQQ